MVGGGADSTTFIAIFVAGIGIGMLFQCTIGFAANRADRLGFAGSSTACMISGGADSTTFIAIFIAIVIILMVCIATCTAIIAIHFTH